MHPSPFPFPGSGDKRYFGRQDEEYYYSPDQQLYHNYDSRYSTGYVRTPTSYQYSMPSPVGPPIEPHENDVLMGRGGRNNQHSGNEKLRQFARAQSDKYKVSSKKQKSALSRFIVQQMRQLDPPARFLKRVQQTATWEEVGDDTAREKASQVLRDAVGGLLEPKEGEPSPPLPTVSAQTSLDEHEQHHHYQSTRSRSVRPRPEAAYSSLSSSLPEQHHSESSIAKRPRYSTTTSTSPSTSTHAYSHHYDERYTPHRPTAAAPAGVSYSPLRRHSGDSIQTGVARSSVPMSHQRYYHPGSAATSSTTRTRSQGPPPLADTPSSGISPNLGTLTDFDLFNGELLDSDQEEDDDDEPLPVGSASGPF